MTEPGTDRATPAMIHVADGSVRHRPVGVFVLAIADIVIAAQSFATVLGVTEARPGSTLELLLRDFGGLQPVFTAVLVASVVAAALLWLLLPLGWYLTMLFTGLGLLFQIVAFFVGTPSNLYLAVWVASAFYLNQREVKEIFLGTLATATTVRLETDHRSTR